MAQKSSTQWVLPASIPFDQLKRADLEECVYWLLDAMGAKDLEWRRGGSGDGAPDQGRDLEAHFYTPSADGDIETQKWWIECKGRTGTVEPNAVKSAVNNALAIDKLDYLVIATNSTFSNPTRDWVKEWQITHPRPKVKLWDCTQLERFLTHHPAVVLRLFAQALSSEGRLRAVETRFWDKFEYTTSKALAEFWALRKKLEFTAMGVFGLIANEFANGSIVARPWAAILPQDGFLATLEVTLTNVPYLVVRGLAAGADQRPIIRALAYLVLVALDKLPVETVATVLTSSVAGREGEAFPVNVQETLLLPILDQLMAEMQDVCTPDCQRMSGFHRNALATTDHDEVERYWLRLEPSGGGEESETDPSRYARLERYTAPCNVGFALDKEHGCPLFELEPSISNVSSVTAVLKRVMQYRKTQAATERQKKAASK